MNLLLKNDLVITFLEINDYQKDKKLNNGHTD